MSSDGSNLFQNESCRNEIIVETHLNAHGMHDENPDARELTTWLGLAR